MLGYANFCARDQTSSFVQNAGDPLPTYIDCGGDHDQCMFEIGLRAYCISILSVVLNIHEHNNQRRNYRSSLFFLLVVVVIVASS